VDSGTTTSRRRRAGFLQRHRHQARFVRRGRARLQGRLIALPSPLKVFERSTSLWIAPFAHAAVAGEDDGLHSQASYSPKTTFRRRPCHGRSADPANRDAAPDEPGFGVDVCRNSRPDAVVRSVVPESTTFRRPLGCWMMVSSSPGCGVTAAGRAMPHLSPARFPRRSSPAR